MCLARGVAAWYVLGEWVTGLGLDFTNYAGTCRKWDMCLCFGCSGVCGVCGVVLCLYPIWMRWLL